MFTGTRVAVAIWALCVALSIATAVLLVIGADGLLSNRPYDIFSGLGGAAFLLLALTFASVGALIVRRIPGHPLGWVFCITGLLNAVNLFTWNYVIVDLYTPHDLPGATASFVVNSVIGEQTAGWLGLTLLLFPDGRVRSRRARTAVAALIGGMALLVIAGTFTPGTYDEPFAALSNPMGIGSASVLDAIDYAGWLLVTGGVVAGVAALVVRLRRARGVRREQLKLVLAVGAVGTVTTALVLTTWLIWPEGALPARMAVLGFSFALFPLAVGAAILRRGLYEIDVAINRTLVYGSVTLVLGAAFAGTTLLLGTALGQGSPWATAGATLVVAAAFRPLRSRVQDVVDRRFNRARYDALQRMTTFNEALRAGRAAPEEVETLLRELVADPTLELRFFVSDYVDARGAPVAPAPDRVTVPIERAGQPLGQIVHAPLGADQDQLLRRLVETGGLAIEIARLRVELRRQLAEVKRSRARIVTAANEERRRIERDLHDGAQQRLVAIGLTLRHAQHQLDTSPERVRATLDGAVTDVAETIEELRELARGLPPAQLDAGLAPAFRELAARAPVPVEVRASGERFEPGVEAAAYFIGCEALTNAIKHARASRIALSAERVNGHLVVAVTDDGVGGAAPGHGSGLTGLSDRIAALGGTLLIESAPGCGTALTAELPCAS